MIPSFKYAFICLMVVISSCSNQPAAPSTPDSQIDGSGGSNHRDSVSLGQSSTVVNSFSVQSIVDGYLSLKNALASDQDKAAVVAGHAIVTAIDKMVTSPLAADQLKTYTTLTVEAREHADHIQKNPGHIKHQREHFEMLSQIVYKLVKMFGTEVPLYYDFCPMYNEGKGGYWLSAEEEIKNPYFGNKMLKCGSVKETLVMNAAPQSE